MPTVSPTTYRRTVTAPSASTAVPRPTATARPSRTPDAPRPTPTLPTLDADARGKRFDEVWQAVADHYLYADFRGVDWNAIREVYRPRAITAPVPEAFYATLSEMVRALGDEHSRYSSPQGAWEDKALTQGTDAYVGIGVVVDDGPAAGVIRTVFNDSPAEEAGLKRRDQILSVDGLPFALGEGSLRGPAGTIARLEVRSPSGPRREVLVTRRAITAKMAPEARRLSTGKAGYLYIPSFFNEDMADQVTRELRDLLKPEPPDGLILDLRGNGGGWRTVLETVLGCFVEGGAGEFFNQGKSYPVDVKPNDLLPSLRDVPLVVLVDRHTESYAEVLAAVLREAGQARIVGQQTPGNTESIYAYDFDDGSRLWVAQEGYRLPSGLDLEGRGVTPDEVIDANWALFPEAEDPHILRALDLLALTSKVSRTNKE